MASSSFRPLVVLAIVLLSVNPIEVQAKRTLRLYKLEKPIEKKKDLQCHLRIAEFEENVLKVSGELKQHVPMDNDWKVRYRISRMRKLLTIPNLLQIHLIVSRAPGPDEEFEEVIDLPELGLCDVMKTYYKEFFYEKLKEYSNAPHPNTCPLPPDHYELEDFPLDVHLFKKLLLPGYYRIVSRLLHEERIKLEYMAELEIME
ncbi:hypothetical protein KR038_007764 [Drosophila bunnanda]|nr:hypothetical protein KR038_007764 [Drosophila bunnanda]